MITRLASRHRSTVRNPYGPPSSGFPSVRSKMLRDEDVRGDMFIDNQKFNYSHYIASEDYHPTGRLPSHNMSICGTKPTTTPAGGAAASARSSSIDAAAKQRPLDNNGHQPGSFAEKEAFMLLNKISEINNICNAPKQPC